MREILITNNETVKDAYEKTWDIIYIKADMTGVLESARDYVHKGHKLLSHPLSGSVKPNENPYKSILVSSAAGVLDLDSLRIIENCLESAKKFPVKYKNLSDELKRDFQKVDYSLITSAFCNKGC